MDRLAASFFCVRPARAGSLASHISVRPEPFDGAQDGLRVAGAKSKGVCFDFAELRSATLNT
ncbi:MAG TPA: hypothetical protein VFI49_00665, partial [Rudaea sp.]|nr:hypothetical protein [Rudaea sp.]